MSKAKHFRDPHEYVTVQLLSTDIAYMREHMLCGSKMAALVRSIVSSAVAAHKEAVSAPDLVPVETPKPPVVTKPVRAPQVVRKVLPSEIPWPTPQQMMGRRA